MDEMIVSQKAAQLGFTEWALNKTFFKIGVERVDCLYVLPARTPDATDFSSSRFDVALELSPSLENMFSDVKNVGHKRAGTANLYVRGSRARSALKSIPVGFIVFDEVDEMETDNIPLAMERTSGQRVSQILMLSTPTVDDYGINSYFKNTTQDHFFFRCPHCGVLTELTYPECLVITAEDYSDPKIMESYYICKECKGRLEHEDKPNWLSSGRWVQQFPDKKNRGCTMPQMYSFGKAGVPGHFAIAALKAQENPADEQEFYNSKLAKTHVVDGAKVTDEQILECKGNHQRGPQPGLITMGVDVGRWLHVEIDQWFYDDRIRTVDINAAAFCRVINQTKVREFAELHRLMREYNVTYCVIDMLPERRHSLDFALSFPGQVSMCIYGNGITGKGLNHHPSDIEPKVTVDRTSWLDLSLGRFRTRQISLPVDTNQEYKLHVKNLVRVYEKDDDGNVTGKYVKVGDDHYGHARNYAEIALPLALSSGLSANITRPVL